MSEEKVTIQVYMDSNNVFSYEVDSVEKAREHAKRIVTEGFIGDDGNDLVYYPVARIYKVKILNVSAGKYVVKAINL